MSIINSSISRCELPIADFFSAFQTEKHQSDLFLKYNTNYKYCNEKLFKFDSVKNLWLSGAIKENFCVDFTDWLIRSQDGYLLDGINKKIELTQDNKKDLTNIISKKTKMTNTLTIYKTSLPALMDNNFVKDTLDKKFPRLVPFNNSVFDLETKTISPRTKEHAFSYIFNGEYIPNVKYTDTFNNFINQICCNNDNFRLHLQKILGYCISGETSAQSFFVFTGDGSNGKSLIMSLLKKIMSDAYQPIKREVMIEKAGYDTGNALYAIQTARTAVFQESQTGDKLNEGTIKSISGEDEVACKKLFEDLGKNQNMKLYAKLILCTNKKPNWDSTQHSMVRRFQPFYFNATFVDTQEEINKKIAEDPNNKNKYFLKDCDLLSKLTNEHLNEFFSWCCDGFSLWLKDKNFVDAPEEIKADKKKDIDEMNSLKTWFENRIIIDKTLKPDGKNQHFIICSHAYKDYKKFCEERDYKIVLTLKELKTMMKEKNIEIYKSGEDKYRFVRFPFEEKEDKPTMINDKPYISPDNTNCQRIIKKAPESVIIETPKPIIIEEPKKVSKKPVQKKASKKTVQKKTLKELDTDEDSE